jgi:serine/threonine protein kinase
MEAENAGGLCPRCLIALNLSSPTEAPTGYETDTPEGHPGGRKPAVAPSLAEIAAYFPELEILQLLGRGGMGAVYMARQPRLARLVALKILPPTVSKDPSFAERFAREAQALARLNHPHIVTLYEFGQKDGLFYFLMEYVDGMNLRQLLNTSRLASREALAIVPQICDALQYAHEQGIVHRDIKPENLLLTKQGKVKIADFGVAKLVVDRSGNPELEAVGSTPEPGLTRSKGTLGTPQYMAPEQVARPLEVDHRADIYSLGVVFYQMLTGELPAGKFEPPSIKARIDVRLDQVVLRALEKQPERRYQHVSEVTKDLETIQETAGQESSAPASASPAPSPFGRRTMLARVILLATGGLLLIPGFIWWLKYSKPPTTHSLPSGLSNGWEQRASADLLKGRSSSASVWTGKEMIIFGGEGLNVSFGDGARYDPDRNAWTPLLLQGAAPSARTCATVVWTGSAMIVWGGFGGSDAEDINRNDGARFYPTNDVWKPVSTTGAPGARYAHTAVWTGHEMLIWGGFSESRTQLDAKTNDAYLNTGGRYDPATDSWKDITTNGAPSRRIPDAAVWTGREMLIWGGRNLTGSLNDGACYDPANDSWRPMSMKGAPSPRSMALAAWTGKEMIVWSGFLPNTNVGLVYFNDGARYNPQTDIWTPMNINGAPTGRVTTQAIWTGKEMLVWGGVNDAIASSYKDPRRYVGDGARYSPTTDTWTTISAFDAPTPRAASAMVWSGKRLLLFGGYNGKHLDDTFCYLPPSY